MLFLTIGSRQHRGHSTLRMPWTHCPTMGGRSRAGSETGVGATDGSGLRSGATFGVLTPSGGSTTPMYAMRASCTYCLRVLPRYAARLLQLRTSSGSTSRRLRTAIIRIVHFCTDVSSGTSQISRWSLRCISPLPAQPRWGFAAASMAKSLSLLMCSNSERMCMNSPEHIG